MKKHILIADDNAAIVVALQMTLELEGYKVTASIDGDILRNLKKPYPNLVLLDISMSGVNGSALCKELKDNKETKDIPIILISASGDLKKEAEYANANAFLAKPFDIDELLEKISICLSTSKKTF